MQRDRHAEKEWTDLLSEHTKRIDERSEALSRDGISSHLDGENHFQDIDDWFKREWKALCKKYNVE